MSVRLWEGPAGSGKTYQLIQGLKSQLRDAPLDEHQKVLAVTKMHGSRRRMRDRLESLAELRGRFACMTLDSFAWKLVRRWRSRADKMFDGQVEETDYEEVCSRAGALVGDQVVARWVGHSYPLVVIDEMQDSKGAQLEIIKGLASEAACLVAADDFQDLDAAGENASVAWAREAAGRSGTVVLSGSHRTRQRALLEAAGALRSGSAVLDGSNFKVLGARNHNVGASFVARNLAWWSKSDDIAVISPVRAASSKFVRKLIERVEEKPISKPPVGPHKVPWEASHREGLDTFLGALALPEDDQALISCAEVRARAVGGAGEFLADVLDRERRLTGDGSFTVSRVRAEANTVFRRLRSFGRPTRLRVRAMTVHQAKNREFESVIVLWPYEVGGSVERQRRLLYNAITRAKRRAIVVVQNPSRCKAPPFVP